MSRTTLDQKRAAVKLMSKPGRPIREIAKMKKGNDSPAYSSKSLLKRSKATAKARAKRYSDVLNEMSDEK